MKKKKHLELPEFDMEERATAEVIDEPQTEEERAAKIEFYKMNTIMQLMDQVVPLVHNLHLSENFYKVYGPLIVILSRRLKVSPFQAILISLLIEDGRDMTISEFGNALGYSRIRTLSEKYEFDELIDLHIFLYSNEEGTSYCMNNEALEEYCKNRTYKYVIPTGLDNVEFFNHAYKILSNIKRSGSDTRYRNGWNELATLLNANPHLSFAKSLLAYNLSDVQRITLIYMANRLFRNNRSSVCDVEIQSELNCEYFDGFTQEEILSSLVDRGLIQNAFDEGSVFEGTYSLTTKACVELFPGLSLEDKLENTEMPSQLVDSSTFADKTLFYNENDRQQIEQLSNALKEEQYQSICNRLKEMGLRSGLACLFYGAPGCGKTETANMLAKATGRSIMPVNVEEIKSKWVGSTEKNIKRVFTQYRNFCKHVSPKPILLFNEADAVMGKRLENVSSSADTMNNSMQNIILQEMETFDGILIATTNLTNNLDDAFERRFLYKIEFHRPDKHTRSNIWQSMIPELSSEDANILAEKYDITGGQIENVKRLLCVNYIISGTPITIEEVEKLCLSECINSKETNKVGFNC